MNPGTMSVLGHVFRGIYVCISIEVEPLSHGNHNSVNFRKYCRLYKMVVLIIAPPAIYERFC